MMSIHDGNLIWTPKEEEIVIEGVTGSSAKASTSSSSSMYSDLTEDASSSSSSSSNGPFEDLSDLISQLPIIHHKKGLSRFYQGKSQSFTSLANVTSVKDLVKRRSRIKSCRSSGGLLKQKRKMVYSPNATIYMKSTRTPSSHFISRS